MLYFFNFFCKKCLPRGVNSLIKCPRCSGGDSWQGSSVGQSIRFIPVVSRVQISPLLPECNPERDEISRKPVGGFPGFSLFGEGRRKPALSARDGYKRRDVRTLCLDGVRAAGAQSRERNRRERIHCKPQASSRGCGIPPAAVRLPHVTAPSARTRPIQDIRACMPRSVLAPEPAGRGFPPRSRRRDSLRAIAAW